MTIGTCYKPLHTTECKQECIEGKSTGFYKDLDGNIYDYNFEIGTKRVDGEDPKNDSKYIQHRKTKDVIADLISFFRFCGRYKI